MKGWRRIRAGPTLCVSCNHSIENHGKGGCYVDLGNRYCDCQAEPPSAAEAGVKRDG